MLEKLPGQREEIRFIGLRVVRGPISNPSSCLTFFEDPVKKRLPKFDTRIENGGLPDAGAQHGASPDYALQVKKTRTVAAKKKAKPLESSLLMPPRPIGLPRGAKRPRHEEAPEASPLGPPLKFQRR